MPTYHVNHAYTGTVNGVRYDIAAGADLDVVEDAAANINADAPGTLAQPEPALASEAGSEPPPVVVSDATGGGDDV